MLTSSFFISSEHSLTQYELVLPDTRTAQSVLILIFSSQASKEVKHLAQRLHSQIAQAHILGISTPVVVQNGTLHQQGTLVLIQQFFTTQLTSAVANYSQDPKQDIAHMVQTIAPQSNTKAGICLCSRHNFHDAERLRILNQHQLKIPLAGADAADAVDGRWVLYQDRIYRDAFVVVAMHSNNLHVSTAAYTEWTPIGRSFRVTKAIGKQVFELDGQCIHRLYERYLANRQTCPLEMKYHFPLIKGPQSEQNVFMAVVEDEESVHFHQPLKVGDEVRFCFDHPTLTLEQMQLDAQRLQHFQPEYVAIFNCTSRLNFMTGEQEYRALKDIIECGGGYFSGELWFDGEQQQLLHHSMTYLALREGNPSNDESMNLLAQTRQDIVVAPLFNLIRNTLLDLDEMNQNLEHKVQQQAELLFNSYRFDRRTGLPNRIVLREKLQEIQPNQHLLAVKMANFNFINERYGYFMADRLLRHLSRHFKGQLKQRQLKHYELFTIGVGEWGLIFSSELSTEAILTNFVRSVEVLESTNFESIVEPKAHKGIDFVSISLRAGLVSRRDFPEMKTDELLFRAIDARHYAQQHNWHIYNAAHLIHQDKNRQERLHWLSCVSRAILHDRVLVYGQPVVKAHTHELCSYECLVRIEENGQLMLPGQFLPVIEGTHLYNRLSRQMIKLTFDLMRDRTEWFSINLSAQDFMSEETLVVIEQGISSISDPSRVGLEVLENEKIKDYAHMIQVCNRFRQLGASIMIDDFGSGYSNIDEILKLEPQIIKLDGSLIRHIDHDQKQRKITQQLVNLCQVLEAKTIAEFVHNEAVMKISEDMGINYLQGFYFAQPQSLVQLFQKKA